MSRTLVALVLHGSNAEERQFMADWSRRNPQIVDERQAMGLGGAYCEGANLIATRLASALFPTMKYSSEWLAFTRQHEPSYTDVRNFLEGDCNVAPLLAAKVALRCTRPTR